MVSDSVSIKKSSICIPILGLIALGAMFLKLPEVSNFFGCKACLVNDPYIPLIGAGYFGGVIATSLLFPSFPNRYIAWGGLIWATVLALILTFVHHPRWCPVCLVGHACNAAIWSIWLFTSSKEHSSIASNFEARLCLTLFSSVSVIALFSSLNLTFMAYGFRPHRVISKMSLQVGDTIPIFTAKTFEGRSISNTESNGVIINFVVPDCPYCKEQLQILNEIAMQRDSLRFIAISPILQPEMMQYLPGAEWIEDKESELSALFKINGYPTLHVIGDDGKIAQIILGVPDKLEEKISEWGKSKIF